MLINFIIDFEEVSTLMCPNDPYFELIYHDDMIYEGCIDSKFTLMHKGILIIT